MVWSKEDFQWFGSHKQMGRDNNTPDCVQTVCHLLSVDTRRVAFPCPQLIFSWCTQDGRGSHLTLAPIPMNSVHIWSLRLTATLHYVFNKIELLKNNLSFYFPSACGFVTSIFFSNIKMQQSEFTSDLGECSPQEGGWLHSPCSDMIE